MAFLFALMPLTHLSANNLLTFESRSIEVSNFVVIRGSAVQSSNRLAVDNAYVTDASAPITNAATCSTLSQSTGLTLPGIMEEPACSSGSINSLSPATGPDPIKRISFAIFVRITATSFNNELMYKHA